MKIVPAILANDIDQFNKYLVKCEGLGVDEIQIDICDGRFVDNKTVSINKIKQSVIKYNFKLQFHLMVESVPKYLAELEEIKTKIIYIHFEALKNNRNFVGKNIGLAVSPETQIESIKNFLPNFTSVLIMTVEPGFYGGKFLVENLEKIDGLRKLGFKGKIGIDGGIDNESLKKVIRHKPDFVCSGSYLLNSEKPIEVWEKYQKLNLKSEYRNTKQYLNPNI